MSATTAMIFCLHKSFSHTCQDFHFHLLHNCSIVSDFKIH